MTKTTKIILIVSILVLLYGILLGCKDHKKLPSKWTDANNATRDTMVIVPDSTKIHYQRWNEAAGSGTVVQFPDSTIFGGAGVDQWTLDTVTTYVFEGEYDHPIGKVKHTMPIKYGQLALRCDPPNYGHDYISIIDTAFFGRLRYAPFVGEPKGYDTLPIHWTSDSTQAYFLLEDIQSDSFSISDSIETVAVRDNKTRKWEITDCQRALEVMYMLDSIRNADYDVEYKPKKKK